MLAICYHRGTLGPYSDSEKIKHIEDKINTADVIIAPIADNLFVQIVQTSFISIFLYYKMDQDTALHLFLQFSIPSACYNACT